MKWKQIAVIGACSLAFGVSCYAAGGVESIEAYQNRHIKFVVNGNPWIPQDSDAVVLAPVILNGASYIPTKAVVEALGGKVEWIDAAKTIAITSAGGTNAAVPADERDQLITNKINEIKEKLKVGLAKEDVEGLFKEKYEIVKNNGDLEDGGDSYWKYDFFQESGYHREDLPGHIVDEDGLKNNKIGASLFIGWKENQLLFYSISYVHPKDQQVYLFFKDSRGISDNPVSFIPGNAESIQAYLNHDIKFTVNDKAWTPQDSDGNVLAPVILSGTSYIPTKAIVKALGGQVEWVDASRTIVITSANRPKTS